MVASFKQIEPYIIQSESHGNNYTPQQNYNYPTSTASGYYQITNTTWSGIPTSITGGTPSAYQATFAQQQAAAQWLWDNHNGSDWLCPGCNSTVVAANNALMAGNTPATSVSPQVSNLIGSNGGASTGSSPQIGGAPGQYNPYVIDPSTGQPYGSPGEPSGTVPGVPNTSPDSINPQTGQPVSSGTALSQIGAFAGNWAVRLGLIAVGIVLIGAAAHSLAEEHGGLPAIPIGE